MKYRAVASVSVLCAFAACAPSDKVRLDVALGETRHAPSAIAPVARPQLRPWKIGQWVIYATPDGGYQTIEVAGEDACGMWFDTELVSAKRTLAWGICLHAPSSAESSAQPLAWVKRVMLRDEHGSRSVSLSEIDEADAFGAVVRDLFPARWETITSQREDVDVRAGHFVGVVRTDEPGGTRWTHPAVPFGATVRFRTADGQEFALVAFGDDGSVNPVRRTARRFRAPISYVGLGFAGTRLSGHRTEPSDSAGGAVLELGRHVLPELDMSLSEALLTLDDSSRNLLVATAGVHWYPFAISRPRFARYGAEGLFLTGELGYAELGARNEDRANGAVAHVGIGWLDQHPGWGVAFELGDRLIWFNQDAGLRHDLAGTIGLRGEL